MLTAPEFVDLRHYPDRVVVQREFTVGWPERGIPLATAWASYETDGASIPRLAWSLIGPPIRGPYVVAAVCHDFLYGERLGSRLAADDFFLAVMERDGVDEDIRQHMYQAVRRFGAAAWNA